MSVEKTVHDRIDIVYRQLGINPNKVDLVNNALNLGSLHGASNSRSFSDINSPSKLTKERVTLIGVSNYI